MKKFAAVWIAIGGVAFAAAPIAHADNDWMAMAISDSTGQIKIANGAASQADAEKSAMDRCRKNISDCRLLASGGPGGCVALALNGAKTRYFGGWGPTPDAAEAAALAVAGGGGTVQAGHDHCSGDPAPNQ
ncbi:DUF4189 domain-containing protein [Mycobacterium sp. HUMS_1102779]|uniref:DUF4189 domain-containing protein n=1 Tax=Mycobacterium sp. HUMS_1102779 TaxID=3383487 RepID=UPI00389A439E